jgi:hypothetical protein
MLATAGGAFTTYARAPAEDGSCHLRSSPTRGRDRYPGSRPRAPFRRTDPGPGDPAGSGPHWGRWRHLMAAALARAKSVTADHVQAALAEVS